MQNSGTSLAAHRNRVLDWVIEAAVIVGATFFIAFCARLYLRIPGTPVPLTVQNLAVLVVGLAFGSRRAVMALLVYLGVGALGLPVFLPSRPRRYSRIFEPHGRIPDCLSPSCRTNGLHF